jgi:hypothetical protein
MAGYPACGQRGLGVAQPDCIRLPSLCAYEESSDARGIQVTSGDVQFPRGRPHTIRNGA